jgi:HAE1 family hydrophobic/amphiphilic exporter-1
MRRIWLVLLTGASLFANDIVAPSRIGVGGTQRRLTLDEAVALAMGANLDVAIERTNVYTAARETQSAMGSFDPTVHFQPTFGDVNTPAVSSLDGANGILTQHSAGQTLAYHQQTPWNGLTFDTSFDNSRVTSANPFVSLNPFYTTQLTFAVTQPLMRGRKTDAQRALVTIRRRDQEASLAVLEERALAVATEVEQAYWDLVAARRQVDVDAEAANLARIQLEQDRRMIAAGSLPQVELSAAEAELERHMDALYRSTGNVTAVENNLKTLLARDRSDTLWQDEIVPLDSGAAAPPAIVVVRDAVEEAVRRRPELKEIDANLAANEVRTKQNADVLRPQVNVVASYSLAGLAGSVRTGLDPFSAVATPLYERVNALSESAGLPSLGSPVLNALPASIAGGPGSSFSSMFRGNYQTVQAGLTLDFTIHNRTASANLAEAAIARKRLDLMRDRAEQAIEAQARNALQALETARQRVRAAEAGAVAAKEKLESETRLFESGESTNFLVLTRQNEYSDARRLQVEADAAFNKAVAQYEGALGTTLETRNIRVE